MTPNPEPGPILLERASPERSHRWYDPHRIVLTLFGVVGFLIVCISGFTFSMAHASSEKNLVQDVRIEVIEKTNSELRKFLEKIDGKIDRQNEKIDGLKEDIRNRTK